MYMSRVKKKLVVRHSAGLGKKLELQPDPVLFKCPEFTHSKYVF